MTWPRDDAKLDRVRALMADRELDALVVRAPDNVLYLTDYWSHEGLRPRRLPAGGRADARRARAAGRGGRTLLGRRRAPLRRLRRRATRGRRSSGRSRRRRPSCASAATSGSASSCRSARRPPTSDGRRADDVHARLLPRVRHEVDDATPLLVEARAIKTAQEIERIRLANELAAEAMEHVRGLIRPGMTESEAAAIWEGYVHGVGTGYRGQVELARGFTLVWSGPGIRTFTATGSRPVVEGQPTLFEIWVCCDGYWADHTKNLCVGRLEPRYVELLEAAARRSTTARSRTFGTAPSWPGSTGTVREGIAAAGYPGPAVAPDLPRRRRPRPRAAVRAPGGRRRHARGNGARDRAGDLLARGAAACASRTTSSSRRTAPRSCRPFPDGIVTA